MTVFPRAAQRVYQCPTCDSVLVDNYDDDRFGIPTLRCPEESWIFVVDPHGGYAASFMPTEREFDMVEPGDADISFMETGFTGPRCGELLTDADGSSWACTRSVDHGEFAGARHVAGYDGLVQAVSRPAVVEAAR